MVGRTQALLLLATKALRELVLCFFLPEIEGRIKDGERKKKRLSLVRGIHGQMKREAFSLKRRTRSLLESTVLCGSYNGQQSLIYPLQGLC